MRRGGVVAYPTEAVFGLGCDPLNKTAVHHLLALKQRPVSKGLILIAAEFSQLQHYVVELSPEQRLKLKLSWPGAVTWLIPARPQTPRWLRGNHAALAVRVTAHPVAAALCRLFGGPIVSTSANIAGRPPARNPLQVHLRCPGTDLILHGATSGLERPTPIQDAITGEAIRP